MRDDTTMFRLLESVGSKAASGESGAAYAQQAPRSIFETKGYRAVYGVSQVVDVDVGNGPALTFEDRGDHAICLARTAQLDTATVERASEALFAQRRFQFIVFEDVHLAPGFSSPPASVKFHYQNDWVLPLGGSEEGLRRSFQRKMDKKLRRMTRDLDDVQLSLEPQPSRQTVEHAIQLNRRRIVASGRTYQLSDDRQEKLVDAFSHIGVASVLRQRGQLVAADLFVECGREAYSIVCGYDEQFHRVSPGLQTLRHAVDHFEGRGFRAVHFMWGDGAYKAWIGAQKVPLSTLIVPRSPGAWLGPRILREAIRYGFKDAKRRTKERGWHDVFTQWAVEWPRALRPGLRTGT